MQKNKKKNKDEMPVVMRLDAMTRQSISRHGTVVSKKTYSRKGRGFKKFMEEEIRDQIENSDSNLFYEDLLDYYLEDDLDWEWDENFAPVKKRFRPHTHKP